MKKICITLMAVTAMALSSNSVAQATGSLNEYGETIDEFGGIVAPPSGDTVKFRRVAGTAIYRRSSSTTISNPQQGTALMVICNDSVYYWKSPISLMTESRYWIKGLCDKQAQTVIINPTRLAKRILFFVPIRMVVSFKTCEKLIFATKSRNLGFLMQKKAKLFVNSKFSLYICTLF